MPPRADVIVVGRPADERIRDFLTRGDQPYRWLDAAESGDLLRAHGAGPGDLPLVLIDDEPPLLAPTLEQVAAVLGIWDPPRQRTYDLIIVGAGPAGLAAAVYAASDGLSVAVSERDVPGGQTSATSRIENYFGIDPHGEPMTGARLARIGGRQAETFGAELLILRAVVRSRPAADGGHEVDLNTGETLRCAALLAASGMEWRRLEAEGIDDFLGRGVYYGAGRSEAPLLGGQRVVIVGAGNSAGQAALHLADHAASVVLLARGGELGASLSGYLVDRIRRHPRIEVRLRTQVAGVAGDTRLREVRLQDGERLPADAMFIAIGGRPRTDWAAGHGLRADEVGYLLTGVDRLERGEAPPGWPLQRPPYALETNVPGVFAAGDVRYGSTKRVAAAVGDGAMAVALVHRYLAERDAAG